MALPKYNKTTRQMMEFKSRVIFLEHYKKSLHQINCKKKKKLYDYSLISFYNKKINRIKNFM